MSPFQRAIIDLVRYILITGDISYPDVLIFRKVIAVKMEMIALHAAMVRVSPLEILRGSQLILAAEAYNAGAPYVAVSKTNM